MSSSLPIVFLSPDDPEKSRQTLSEVLASLPQIPVLGLIIKVSHDGKKEIVVNWMFADATLVKSLALVLPNQATSPNKE